MFPILGLGERLHPELDAIFVSSPDKAGAQFPPVGELRKYWDQVNGKLISQFATLSEDEWLQRHYAMSEEDYAKDPTRNVGCSAESNQPPVLPPGADYSGSKIAELTWSRSHVDL